MSSTISLSNISEFITKGATPTTYGYKWELSGVPFLRSECVSEDGLNMAESMFISIQADRALRRSRVVEGDLLITITGNVGRVIRFTGFDQANINQHIARARINSSSFDSRFVYHYLSQTNVREKFESITTGQAYPQLSLAQVRNVQIPVMPLSVQEEIADALDTADELISNLENVAAKKRDVKQGMMQELLTGGTRLPGFAGEWRSRTIGEVANVIMGQSPPGSSYNQAGTGLPLIQGNADIQDRRTFERVWTTSPTKVVGEGGVVLTVRAPVGFTARAHANSCLGRGVCALSSVGSNDFLFHAMVAAEPKWGLFEQGSTFTSVNSDQVRSFVLEWPPDVEEQKQIAAIVDDVDAEIDALERRLESARAVKLGMMQELLTGRTRFPLEEEA